MMLATMTTTKRELVFKVTHGETTYALEREEVPVPARGKKKASSATVWYLNGTKATRYWTGDEQDRRTIDGWCRRGEEARLERLQEASKDADFRQRTGIVDPRFELGPDGSYVNVELQLSLSFDEAAELYAWLRKNAKTKGGL